MEPITEPKYILNTGTQVRENDFSVTNGFYFKCQGSMRIISFIEDEEVIEKVLRHLDLWETRNHDPPVRYVSHISELTYDDAYSQIPPIDSGL